MPDLPELTRRQSEAAVRRAGENLALTSGAGCGKTLVLARRFTTLLLAAGAGEGVLDRFVALTFTEKAALEMVERVRRVLLDRLARSRDDADRRRLAGWITELPGAQISTIHSFCASVLRRYAVEAGVDPGFAVLADELLMAQLQSEAAADAVGRAVDAADDRAIDLVAAAGPDAVVADVRELLGRRIGWRASDYADPGATLARWRALQAERAPAAVRELAEDEAVRAALEAVGRARCDRPDDRLAVYRDRTLPALRRILADPEEVTAEDFGPLDATPGNVGSARAWGGKDALLAFRRQLAALVREVGALRVWYEPPGEADAAAARALSVLTALAERADALYAEAKRARGVLDFEDLIDLTARLLRDRPRVRAELGRRLSQLLIDEGQDTDPYQLRMLWDLVAGGETKTPPPGSLFIVGDLKQSIYRFRGAEAEVFGRLCARLGAGARIPLSESFRTHAAGVAFVNDVFAELMGADYEPIASSRAERPDGPSVEILLAAVGADADADAANEAQAELLAERVAAMIGREELVRDHDAGGWRAVRPGDVAVLFARMTQSLAYERALQRRDVPYYVVAGTGFFQQQEIYDCLNALRAVDNPFDDVALFGVLRSGLFGLDDNVLLHVANRAAPPYVDKLTRPAVLEALPAPAARQLAFTAGLLERLRRDKDALGAAGVVEALLDETGYDAVLLSQFQGRRRLGNVRRLVAAARSAEASGRLGLADFVRRFSELAIEQTRYEQAPVLGADEDVVRIMTIHKAKGLEFPVVAIPDLNAGFRGPGGGLLLRQDWGLTCGPPPVGDDEDGEAAEAPVSHRLAREAEASELAAEDVRKLYVAATRHRDHLVLIGADWRTGEGRFRPSGSYLDRLDDVLGIAEAVDAGRGEISYGDGAFRAIVGRAAPTEPPARRGRRPVGLRAVETAADGTELASALKAAGRGGELPLVGPPPAAVVRVAPTALADFQHCPMLYRWRHELRVPEDRAARARAGAGGAGPAARDSAPDPVLAGTLFHRCMELLDFDADLPAQAPGLIRRASSEMDLDVDAGAMAGELAAMLETFRDRPLSTDIRAGRRRLPELAFVLRAGPMEIAGRIDLLYQAADGTWRVVDYKSDRVGPDEAAAHARRYELQMLVYLAAAGRAVGEAPAGAALYFLRAGRSVAVAAGEGGIEDRLEALGAEIARCRAAGVYPPRGDGQGGLCAGCPYAGLCARPEAGYSSA